MIAHDFHVAYAMLLHATLLRYAYLFIFIYAYGTYTQ